MIKPPWKFINLLLLYQLIYMQMKYKMCHWKRGRLLWLGQGLGNSEMLTFPKLMNMNGLTFLPDHILYTQDNVHFTALGFYMH